MKDILDYTLMRDTRVQCLSVMTAMMIDDYLNLVKAAYTKRGGLDHQRDALKTTTAKRIRSRMVSDIIAGAVLPPVVLGAVVNSKTMKSLNEYPPKDITERIFEINPNEISIIDGMQRTTAILEAKDSLFMSASKDRPLRVEFWIAESTDSLIYRMLVLNTGQVPWNLTRQLQVVYAPLIEEMKSKVQFVRILDANASERRTRAGEYAPDNLAELYIAFGLRKTDIDTQETLADEFSRLDMAEALSSHKYRDYFYPAVQMMVDLDCAFSRCDAEMETNSNEDAGSQTVKIRKGRGIFDSKPARVGFIVAVATFVLGRLGMRQDDDHEQNNIRLLQIRENLDALVKRLDLLDRNQIEDFLKLDVLSERLYGQKRSAVGRHERAFFDNAFKVLIDEKFAVPDMEPCWRS